MSFSNIKALSKTTPRLRADDDDCATEQGDQADTEN